MTTAPISKNPINSGTGDSDDLTRIKGIGPVRQHWLRETFNIRTYKDLAALSPEAIESQLQAEGRSTARGEIQRWLAQAQELAAAADQPVASKEAATGTLVEEEVKRPRKADAWRPLASFTVEFRERTAADQPKAYQTAVHHMETDTDATWPGIETKELCAWMLEQVGDRVEQKATEGGQVESKPATASPIPVTITQVRIFQPPNADTPTAIGEPGRPIQGIINSLQPFALEATFQLDASAAAAVSPQTTYYAQFFVRSLATGTNIPLGATRPAVLAASQVAYTARLPQASLRSETYRLQVLVSLQSRPPSVGYVEIPLLQVV